MDSLSFSLSIPLDKDGFLEMECDYCKGRFMLSKKTFDDDNNLDFFCPICGLPNKMDTFYCPEVLEIARQVATNYAMDEIYKQFSKTFKGFNKNGLVKMSMKKPKHVSVSELYTPINDYKMLHLDCCDINIKATSFDDSIGVYCPICGGTRL